MTAMRTPLDNPLPQAIFLRAHLKMLSAGMKNSRMSGTQILAKVSELTGIRYKRGQYSQALTDLNAIIALYRKEEK